LLLPAEPLPSSLQTDATRNGCKVLHLVPPPECLPSVYLTWLYVIRAPGLSLSIRAYCKRSKTGGGNILEAG